MQQRKTTKRTHWGLGLVLGLAGSLVVTVCGFWYWNHACGDSGNLFNVDDGAPWVAAGRLAGILAVVFLFFQVLLVARPGWLEPLVGMDKLTGWHRFGGAWILTLVVAHIGLVTWGHAASGGNALAAQFKLFLSEWDDTPQAVAGTLLLLAVAGLSLAAVRRKLGYEAWHLSHFAMYAAIILSAGHQFEVGFDVSGNPVFQYLWYALYVFAAVHVLGYRLLLPWYRFARHGFTVSGVRQETPDVCSVHITGKNLEKLRVAPGQFAIVRFLAKGFWWQPHPFSFSAPFDGNVLRLSIKGLGDFTRRIPELKPGTRVVLDGPHGAFTAQRCQRREVLLVAGGIGITPLRALAEAFLRDGRDVALLYGNRDRSSVVFEQELDALVGAYPQFRVVHVLGDGNGWAGETGNIDQARIARLVPDCAEREAYVCGPPPMMTGVLAALRALGVPKRNVHYERFLF